MRDGASLLLVENGRIFELGMDGGDLIVIGVNWLALNCGRFSFIGECTYFLLVLIHLSLGNGDISIELVESALVIFGVICL